MALMPYNKEDNQLWFWSNEEKTILENKKYSYSKLLIYLIGMYRVGEPKRDNMPYRNAQPIVRLHGLLRCLMNGNFVDFQNMCNFKISHH